MSNFGTDFDMLSDIDENMTVQTNQRLVLLQAIVRRLTCNGIFYDESYGFDLLNAVGASGSIPDIAQRITIEAMKDERVLHASFEQTLLTDDTLEGTLQISPYGTDSFQFTLSIDLVSGAITAEEPLPIRLPYERNQ